jgi:hypothetical protein
MAKLKLDDVTAGYYLAPAVFDQTLPAHIRTTPTYNKHFEYKTKKHKEGNFTSYHFNTPTQDTLILTESYLSVAKPGIKTFNLRDQLKTPFGLINWLDRPKKDLLRGHLLIQDSGGFQLAVGREDFISPADLLNAHKDIDLGVSLDIPLTAFNGNELTDVQLKRLASVTSRTNKYLEDNGYKSYLNVNHGATIRERLKWLEASRKGVKHGAGLSIGGFRSTAKAYVDPRAFASAAVALIKESGYRYFHFLGATAGWQMVILAALAARYKVVITSDSSTWIQMGISATIYDNNFGLVDIAPRGSPLAHRYLNCNCFVCEKVKWEYVYSQNVQMALGHNLLIMDKVAAEVKDIFLRDPATPVSIKLPFVKENLEGVDDYIDGKKSWSDSKLLRSINVPKGKALFASATSNVAANKSLAIVDKFDEWFKKNG